MQLAMTLTVQGTTSLPWPDPTTAVAPAAPPAPSLQQPVQHAAATHVHSPAVTSAQPYSDSLRVQAFRRDAAAISTQSAPTSSTASTASAPAVKVAPAPLVNPLAVAPETPLRTPPPAAPPAITAPAALDEQSGARGS